ncbi:aminotransferase class III-fold pyridoxal phosphate-dependent enzyme [Gammaproteobacteria bacterium]|nr:aminotransferase class III-fold pyridoxal phosphate-dependent enzyme [Gammaproteobacteria bacterium]
MEQSFFNVIPDQSHTFSKAHHQYPVKFAPRYVTSAHGCVLNTNLGPFTDWSMGLGPVIKGYNFQALNDHLTQKINHGIAYSLPSEYEFEVAHKLINTLKFGDQVRFARNGSDVTSAAIRLARHTTGKEKIICNGYHGWQDWFIGTTTRNSGVPEAVRNLSIKIDSFSIQELEQSFHLNQGEIACVILEPMISSVPNIQFLKRARELCDLHGALLIFDECWTGFRCARKGAIGLTGIKPDLSCYAKALGNGVPVSAIVGNSSVMEGFKEVFFSFTHSSDPIGIAAADFMLDYLDDSFYENLENKTANLFCLILDIIERIKDERLRLKCTSYPGKIVLSAANSELPLEIKSFIQREFLRNKILFNMFFAICEDHTEKEIKEFISVLEGIVIKFNSQNFDIIKETAGDLVSPVFRKQI